jgi:hypothetical protein
VPCGRYDLIDPTADEKFFVAEEQDDGTEQRGVGLGHGTMVARRSDISTGRYHLRAAVGVRGRQ